MKVISVVWYSSMAGIYAAMLYIATTSLHLFASVTLQSTVAIATTLDYLNLKWLIMMQLQN